MSAGFEARTTKLTPSEEAIHATVIKYLSQIDAHLKTCADPNCHIRRMA